MTFDNILVPVDFSDTSIRAVRLAVQLARISGGRLTLVHIGVVPYFYATELGMSGPSGPLYSQLTQDIAREQRTRLERIAREEVPEEIPCRTLIRDGFPPEEVVLQVADDAHDCVVMGTHGRTGVKRALLGSVTERVVRECPVPVMVTH